MKSMKISLKKAIKSGRYYLLFAACMLCSLISAKPNIFGIFQEKSWILAAIGGTTLLLIAFHWANNGGITPKRMVILIFGLGFLIRLLYVIETDMPYRQHDFGALDNTFDNGAGHAGYINYIYEKWTLPDFDVTKYYQFYHPPLHHIICALWLRIQTFLGVSLANARENMQMLTLFYSSACMLLSYRIFSRLKIKGAMLVAICAIVAFHPTFIILSGSVNNDILCITLMLASVSLALRWYQKPSMVRIIPLAFAVGGAAMAKMSGLLVAPAIAMLFIVKLLDKNLYKTAKSEKQRDFALSRVFARLPDIIRQYAVFACISVPIGIWWQLRNSLLFKASFSYVPRLSERADQYIGFRSVFERLFSFSMTDVYPARIVSYADYTYFEFSIPLGILKTALFGEYYVGKDIPLVPTLLFAAECVLVLISLLGLVCLVCGLLNLKNNDTFANRFGFTKSIGWFFTLLYGTLMLSYVKFCFDYPHFCTMDFRYIVPTIVLGGIFIAVFAKRVTEKNKTLGFASKILVCIASALFCICSVVVYSIGI